MDITYILGFIGGFSLAMLIAYAIDGIRFFRKRKADRQWKNTVEIMIKEGEQLKQLARQRLFYHYRHQQWRDEYYTWLKKLLTLVKEQYSFKKQRYVMRYGVRQPGVEYMPGMDSDTDIQSYIIDDAWRLEGELAWLHKEIDEHVE